MTVSTLTVVPEAHASGTAPAVEPPLTRRLRLLDLFCGAGGASAGYHAAGFDVLGVDIAAQPDYPFAFLQADALDVDLAGFDVVHASPPCQAFSRATPTARRPTHPDLIGPVRNKLVEGLASPAGPAAYVIENVPGAPLHRPTLICGDALRLGVRRHRLFESNLPLVGTGCWHDRTSPTVAVYGSYGQRIRRRHTLEGQSSPSTADARVAMGIDWMPWPALTQAIPPAYTFWLGVQLLTLLAALRPASSGSVTSTAAQTSPPPAAGDETRRRLASPDAQVPSVTVDGTDPVASLTRDVSPPAAFRHCHCGRPLPPPRATGRWPRYCSHACRQAAYRHRHRPTPAGRP